MTEEERNELVAKAIRQAMADARKKDKRVTYGLVAEKMGTTYDILNNMANNRTAADGDTLARLRDVLKLPSAWPENELHESHNRSARRYSLQGTPLAPIPLVGKASAGPGEHNVDVEDRELWVPERLATLGTIAKVVDGLSMVPWLLPDDYAIFKQRSQPKRGYAFLIKMPDGEERIKVTAIDRGEWILRSLNPTFAPEPLGGAQVLGILVGFYRYKGRRETMDSDPDGLEPDYEQIELYKSLFA